MATSPSTQPLSSHEDSSQSVGRMTVSPPDPDATLSGVSQQMFVTRHADHDTAVDGGALRRDGEADMQTACSDRQSGVPVESHTAVACWRLVGRYCWFAV